MELTFSHQPYPVYHVTSHIKVDAHDATADTAGQHGLDHPGVWINIPRLECECKYPGILPATSPGRKEVGAASSLEASACREGGEIHWVVSGAGLIEGYVYKIEFELSFQGNLENSLETRHWQTVFSSSRSSYTVRQPVPEEDIPKKVPFFVEVHVRDMHPGLTSEDAVISKIRINSAMNQVRAHCIDLESGDRTNVLLAGEEDDWKSNFSVAIQDVRVSYSETVVALAMLSRYGLDEWARNSLNMSDDDHTVSDLHIPALVFNHIQDGRRASAEGMLRAVGFRDITFQPTYDIETLDLAALVNSGRVSANWDYFVKEQMGWNDISNTSKMRYIAHALDFQDVIERHATAADGSPGASSWIAVFEDDIVLTTSPVHAHKRLVEAVSSLPRDADVLYVEWCFDTCQESSFNQKYPLISLADKPHCSAGVLFSPQGARKLDRLLRPIDSTIDNQFANLCYERAIICYKLRLPIFTQNKKWGSNVDFKKQAEVRLIFSTKS
jgi:hypothetical protein